MPGTSTPAAVQASHSFDFSQGAFIAMHRFLAVVVYGCIYVCFPNFGLACNKRGPQLAEIVPFLEPSYMSVPTAVRNHQWFEGDVAMHFNVFTNYSENLDSNCRNDNWTVLFTPGIIVRMSQARSNPVRNPSYMPRLDVQELFRVSHNSANSTADFWEWHGTIGHHSNGQDGCAFMDESPPACNPPVPASSRLPPLQNLNRKDGSFSTNYVRAGIDHRHSWLTGSTATTDLNLGIEYQRQIATDPELKPLYAQNHINGKISVAKEWSIGRRDIGRWESEFFTAFAFKQPDPSLARWTFAPKLSWFPSAHSSLGLFVRVFYGQDYYNMNFAEKLNWKLRGGVQFSQDRFFMHDYKKEGQ
jgi:hypothetical protein